MMNQVEAAEKAKALSAKEPKRKVYVLFDTEDNDYSLSYTPLAGKVMTFQAGEEIKEEGTKKGKLTRVPVPAEVQGVSQDESPAPEVTEVKPKNKTSMSKKPVTAAKKAAPKKSVPAKKVSTPAKKESPKKEKESAGMTIQQKEKAGLLKRIIISFTEEGTQKGLYSKASKAAEKEGLSFNQFVKNAIEAAL